MRYFKKTPDGTFAPRLSVGRASSGEEMGFLQINSIVKKIEVGSTMSREFRLVQCLFSPQNYLLAKYNPVAQTHERAFGAIRMKADSLNIRLVNLATRESAMTNILEKSLQNLRTGKAAAHLNFFSEG